MECASYWESLGQKMKLWRNWINPKPLSRQWWICWLIGIIFFGTLLFGTVLYVHFTDRHAQQTPDTRSEETAEVSD
jgi:hypothetical protein